MSAKTKIVVLQLKELIYTGIFVLLGIFLILLLIFMFLPDEEEPIAEPSMSYVAGVYQTSITLGSSSIDLEVVLDRNHINSIRLVPLDESVSAMYPLVEPALDNIAAQIYENQSLENISYNTDNQYTSMVLLNAIEDCLEKASLP